MLKPTHIQLVTKMSEGSAVFGSPSQALVQPPSPSARIATFTGPQSML